MAAAGAAFGALVAANAPALTDLSVACNLRDDHLRPLLNALRTNTHLRALDVAASDISAAFVRDVLLPAVRANTSLRCLAAAYDDDTEDVGASAREAEALVAAR
jgi:hypothetical protein